MKLLWVDIFSLQGFTSMPISANAIRVIEVCVLPEYLPGLFLVGSLWVCACIFTATFPLPPPPTFTFSFSLTHTILSLLLNITCLTQEFCGESRKLLYLRTTKHSFRQPNKREGMRGLGSHCSLVLSFPFTVPPRHAKPFPLIPSRYPSNTHKQTHQRIDLYNYFLQRGYFYAVRFWEDWFNFSA